MDFEEKHYSFKHMDLSVLVFCADISDKGKCSKIGLNGIGSNFDLEKACLDFEPAIQFDQIWNKLYNHMTSVKLLNRASFILIAEEEQTLNQIKTNLPEIHCKKIISHSFFNEYLNYYYDYKHQMKYDEADERAYVLASYISHQIFHPSVLSSLIQANTS